MQAYQFRAEEKNVFSDLSKIFYNGAALSCGIWIFLNLVSPIMHGTFDWDKVLKIKGFAANLDRVMVVENGERRQKLEHKKWTPNLHLQPTFLKQERGMSKSFPTQFSGLDNCFFNLRTRHSHL